MTKIFFFFSSLSNRDDEKWGQGKKEERRRNDFYNWAVCFYLLFLWLARSFLYFCAVTQTWDEYAISSFFVLSHHSSKMSFNPRKSTELHIYRMIVKRGQSRGQLEKEDGRKRFRGGTEAGNLEIFFSDRCSIYSPFFSFSPERSKRPFSSPARKEVKSRRKYPFDDRTQQQPRIARSEASTTSFQRQKNNDRGSRIRMRRRNIKRFFAPLEKSFASFSQRGKRKG